MNCSICEKRLNFISFKIKLKDGWLCKDCSLIADDNCKIIQKKDTVNIVKEKIKYHNFYLAKRIMDYKLYQPYLEKCPDDEVRKVCKNCKQLKDVYHTAIQYIEKDNSTLSFLLLGWANYGLGVLYNERAIHYFTCFLENPFDINYYNNLEHQYSETYSILEALANCYQKDYLIKNELYYREKSLEYVFLWYNEIKKRSIDPMPLEAPMVKNIKIRITELKNDIKLATNNNIDLTKPFTNRKSLKRINICDDNIFNLINGEIIE